MVARLCCRRAIQADSSELHHAISVVPSPFAKQVGVLWCEVPCSLALVDQTELLAELGCVLEMTRAFAVVDAAVDQAGHRRLVVVVISIRREDYSSPRTIPRRSLTFSQGELP
jgi:hypothetical protein